MKIKKLLTVVLAVLFVVAASVPTLADRSSSYSHITMFNGAQVYRHGSIADNVVNAYISLSFLPDVPHNPSSDYSTGITIYAYSLNGIYLGRDSTGVCGMYCHLTFSHSKAGEKRPLVSAACNSYLNPSELISLYDQTPTYINNISV